MIVDIDTHINEPMDVFARHLEAPYRARRPRLIEDTWGVARLLLEGRLYPDPRLKQAPPATVDGTRMGRFHGGVRVADRTRGIIGCRGELEGIPAGASDPRARLADLDRAGIDVQVVFGNLGLAISALPHRDFAVAMSRACNDYYADFCRTAPKRLKGMATLPLQDIPAAVAEMERAVRELGLAGVALPPSVNGKNLDHPDLYPIYETAQRLDVPLAVHWGNAAYLAAAGADRFDTHFMTHVFGHPFEQMIAVSCIVCGGILERFPRLRIAFLEAGCGWLPYLVQRLQEHYERRGRDMPSMTRDPLASITAGNCYFGMEAGELVLPIVVRLIGAEALLFGSDYPHTDSTFPDAVRELDARSDLSADARRQMLGENALRFLGLDTEARRPPRAPAREHERTLAS